MDIESFQRLPTAQVAQIVRAAGPKVCVFPINGTRRWFVLEHSTQPAGELSSTYVQVVIQRHIELYQLLFDHGLDTLLTPVFGLDIMERGESYLQMAAQGLRGLATAPAFLEFYQARQVRVRFYGDYVKFFASTPYAYLSDLFRQVTTQTAAHDRHRLFFGLFAHDATETIAEMAVRYHAQRDRVPDKRALVEMYYGEHVDPVDLFIGFDKFSVFDMPLLATGDEDLYFTVSPSLYLSQRQLRSILYDHLYSRRTDESDYEALSPDDWALMRAFYRVNRNSTLGIGAKQKNGGVWYPLPQVELPVDLADSLL